MEQKELQEILELHKKWLNSEHDGVRANLSKADLHNADLRCANLHGADLRCADLCIANLSSADLHCADLSGANLRYADLSKADLRCADLCIANLSSANLHGADLSSADLHCADLRYANLHGADLSGANLRYADLCSADLKFANLVNIKINESTTAFLQTCPEEGSFVGYKKASGKIVVLEIPADAKRSSATTLKCRCDKAKVLRIEELDGTLSDEKEVASDQDKNFIYRVDEIVSVDDFDEDRWNECSHGIHFFINKELAKQY